MPFASWAVYLVPPLSRSQLLGKRRAEVTLALVLHGGLHCAYAAQKRLIEPLEIFARQLDLKSTAGDAHPSALKRDTHHLDTLAVHVLQAAALLPVTPALRRGDGVL